MPDVPHGVRLLRVTPAARAASTVNDDVLQVGYGGDWERNGNQEVAATSQDLAVSVVADGDEPPTPGDTDARVEQLNDDASEISYSGSWSHSTGRGHHRSTTPTTVAIAASARTMLGTGRGRAVVVASPGWSTGVRVLTGTRSTRPSARCGRSGGSPACATSR